MRIRFRVRVRVRVRVRARARVRVRVRVRVMFGIHGGNGSFVCACVAVFAFVCLVFILIFHGKASHFGLWISATMQCTTSCLLSPPSDLVDPRYSPGCQVSLMLSSRRKALPTKRRHE